MFHNLIEVVSHIGDMTFGNWYWLIAIAAVIVLVPLWKRLRPALATTFGNRAKIKSVGWPSLVCTALFGLFWACLCIGMANPQLTETGYTETYQAREFQLLIDDSGSMFSWDVKDEKVAGTVHDWEKKVYERQVELFKKYPELFPIAPKKPEEQPEWQKGRGELTRFSLARYAAYQFVLSRLALSEDAVKVHGAKQGDRVGMAPFDDSVHGGVPITGAMRVVLISIEDLLGEIRSGGTNFDGPHSEGDFRMGAFQFAINQFNNKKLSKPGIKTKVMILISDGDAGISPERHAALANAMKNREGDAPIHVFFFVCGPKSQMENSATNSAKKLLKEVNPPEWKDEDYICWAGSGEAMAQAFGNINRLEASTVEGEPFPRKRDVSYEFVLASMLFGALWLVAAAAFREGF